MQDEVRLIDANDLYKELTKVYKSEVEAYEDARMVLRCVDKLNASPTIDAVPVVRCKDCANSYVPHNGFARRCRKFNRLVGEMDFCSYGLTEEEYNEMERELVEMDRGVSDGE